MIREAFIRKIVEGKDVLDIGSIGQDADYSLWKECADIENGLRKLSAGIEIISPRRFVRGYYGLVDPQHEIPTDSMLRTLSTHPQLGKLISKDKSSFLLLLTFPNDSIPQKALQDWIEQPRSMIEQTRIFGLVQLESAIEETIIKESHMDGRRSSLKGYSKYRHKMVRTEGENYYSAMSKHN
jgi:hypothetical protein